MMTCTCKNDSQLHKPTTSKLSESKHLQAIDTVSAGECCYVAGTTIHTKDGTKPIEHIEIGDLVLTQQVEGGEKAYAPVIKTSRTDNAVVWSLFYLPTSATEEAKRTKTLVQASAYRRLTLTPDHRLWVLGKGWLQVQQLDFDADVLQLASGDTAGIVQVSPLYLSDTDGMGWQQGIFDETSGQLIDLRNGASGELDVFRLKEHQPGSVELWDEASYFRCAVFNLELESKHTYFVGELGVWSQDSSCGDTL
ncbi:Hint domain-containing protein [Nitrogeniibacter aestuarii]|uniref:Hint domain-containing protein n=1 Tax=Nitrogeniibacter aestuarii TaxID=2815343 RepID=UPI001E5B5768|nr:Hint domain-containing protein [Nitrogeniibacter aestuarii]